MCDDFILFTVSGTQMSIHGFLFNGCQNGQKAQTKCVTKTIVSPQSNFNKEQALRVQHPRLPLLNKSTITYSRGSRISEREVATLRWGGDKPIILAIFPENCMKLAKKIWGGTCVPSGPSQIRH